MAHYTREELLGLVEQGSSHVTPHDQPRHITTPVFPVSIRQQIYFTVVSAGRGVTRREVARMVNRKPAGWINRHLDALVRQGYLTRTEYTYHNGMPVYYYQAAD